MEDLTIVLLLLNSGKSDPKDFFLWDFTEDLEQQNEQFVPQELEDVKVRVSSSFLLELSPEICLRNFDGAF